MQISKTVQTTEQLVDLIRGACQWGLQWIASGNPDTDAIAVIAYPKNALAPRISDQPVIEVDKEQGEYVHLLEKTVVYINTGYEDGDIRCPTCGEKSNDRGGHASGCVFENAHLAVLEQIRRKQRAF